MKKLLVIALVSGVTYFVWHRQRPVLEAVRTQNERLAAVAAELQERAERAESGRQSAEQHLAGLRGELHARQAAAADKVSQEPGPQPAPPPEPDPVHQGGWAPGVGFFYLPKQYLTNAGYQLLNGGQLTDEAAALLGMSPAEREATDKSFGELLDQFRRLEIQRMELVAAPANWSIGAANSPGAPGAMSFDSAVTYHVPDLSGDISAAQTAFLGQLQQNLGASRADIVAAAADAYLRQNMDDLGAGDRIVGFAWQLESDGTHSLWYAVANARAGEGAFQRVGEDVDPNSQTAYYARLFGVALPGH
jgi:hypothetical protein